VEILGAWSEIETVNRRDIRKVLIFGGTGNIDGSEEFSFLDRLLGPGSGIDVIGGSSPEKVHRDHSELKAGAALEKEDGIGIRDIKKIAKILLGRGVDLIVGCSPVTGLQDREAGPSDIHELFPGLSHNFLRKDRRPGI
jgi:hypothetical protein